jgi:hypothetical protein
LIEESPWKENPQKYRKVAHSIVRRVLSFDPSNEAAKLLLESLEKNAEVSLCVAEPEAGPAPEPQPAPAPKNAFEPATPDPPRPQRPVAQPDFFVVEPPRVIESKSSGRPPWVLVAAAAIGAVAGLTLLVTHRSAFSQNSRQTHVAVPAVVHASTTIGIPEAVKNPAPPPLAEERVSTAAAARIPPKLQPPDAQPAVVVKAKVAPVAPMETGTLAVSSPTTADIYLNDQLVGSAPTTLVLPVGTQTLEYRHQDMRKLVTHTIKTNETTTAMITFDITVQINAKPWAQVSIDGSKPQPLGQTPLSDVTVPIGSNLIFQNPNFPAKSYRITGRETQIRVSFP